MSKPMPLLMAASKPWQGPMVPVLGRLKKVKSDGLAPEDLVEIKGWKGDDSEILGTLRGNMTELNLDLTAFDYVQATVKRVHAPIFVWLEDQPDGN